jgi:mannose-1-phosphate guanylyltransferase
VELEKSIPEIPHENIIFEPVAKNTASCIGLAAQLIYEKNPDAVMSVFPADHLITDDEVFSNLLTVGFELASQKDYLLTLGMKPGYPETGYGYIKSGSLFQSFNGFDFFLVDRFVEKPDRENAERFVTSGEYYWNGGIFIWKARAILDSIKKLLPNLHKQLGRIPREMKTGRPVEEILEEIYPKLDSVSIDYGILEHANNVLVVPCDIGWSDVGGWTALDTLVKRKSKEGNITWSKHISIDTKDCIIYSPKKLVATIGLENIIIVETDDALLVSTKERSQEVKQIVEKLKESGLEDYL